MKYFLGLYFAICMCLSGQAQFVWNGEGDGTSWDDDDNWVGDAAPAKTTSATITITCASECSLSYNQDVEINGSLSIGPNVTLDLGNKNLKIGKTNNDASLTVDGKLIGIKDFKAEGIDTVDPVDNPGPTVTVNDSLGAATIKIGKNSGNGILNISPGASVGSVGNIHVDGTINNQGEFFITTGTAQFHGGILKGGGSFYADDIEMIEGKGVGGGCDGINKWCGGANGNGVSAGPTYIPSQSFFSADGICTDDADASGPIFEVPGGDGDPATTYGGDLYTLAELQAEFGLTDGAEFEITATITACETPTPVDLISFSGDFDNNKVQLTWNTASELNNEKFIIEKSINQKDFFPIGEVEGNGTTNEPQTYRFDDLNITSLNNYYRIKQVDFDGAYEYHKTIFISLDGDSFGDFEVFPNPTNTGIINIPELLNGSAEVLIYDLSGAVKLRKKTASPQVDIQNLKEGIYIIEMHRTGSIQRAKLLIDLD